MKGSFKKKRGGNKVPRNERIESELKGGENVKKKGTKAKRSKVEWKNRSRGTPKRREEGKGRREEMRIRVKKETEREKRLRLRVEKRSLKGEEQK